MKISSYILLDKKFKNKYGKCYNSVNDNGDLICIENKQGLCDSIYPDAEEKCPFKTDNITKLRKILLKLSSEENRANFLRKFICSATSCHNCPFYGRFCRDWMFFNKEDKIIFSQLTEAIFTEKFDTLK
jgi:hypothetical protein